MKNKYQLIFEEAPEPRILVEAKSLKILNLNKRAKKFFGEKFITPRKNYLPDIFPEELKKISTKRFNEIKKKEIRRS